MFVNIKTFLVVYAIIRQLKVSKNACVSQNPREFTVNSILQSKSTQAFTEKLSPMAVGIKLRLAFGM